MRKKEEFLQKKEEFKRTLAEFNKEFNLALQALAKFKVELQGRRA